LVKDTEKKQASTQARKLVKKETLKESQVNENQVKENEAKKQVYEIKQKLRRYSSKEKRSFKALKFKI
jgi:hypothetical protein